MKQSLLFFLLAALAFVPASAQNNLKAEYKNAASLPDFLNICGDADGVVVTVKTEGLSGATRANISAALQLFRGVEFVTLDAANTSPGVSVTNLANRNRPVFSLPNLSPSGTSSVQIAFSIAANCAYTDTIAANNDAVVFDTWTFTYNLGNQTGLTETDATEEYRTAFKVPTFTLTFDQNDPPAAKVGDCYPRTLTAANSALEGFVDTLVYTDVLGAGVSLKQLYVNGIAIPFTKTGTPTDTTITAIIWGQWFQTALLGGGPGDGDVFLDPDERIVIREDICFVNCAKSVLSAHTIGWGCKGEICSEAIVNGFVRKGDGAPNALITNNISSTENVKVGYCKPGQYVIHFANNGSEIDPGFATMKDLEVQIGLNTQVLLKTTHLEITKIQIAGQNVAPLATTTVLGGNPLFASDPDGPGGLEDVDGDGFFDDLRTGGTFDVLVDFEFDCDSANMIGMDSLCLNEFNIAWNAYLKYTDPCAERVTKSLPNFGGIQHSNEESINCIDPDAFPGQPFMVQHVETRGVRTFEKDCGGTERLVAWVKLPAGVTADVSAVRLFKNNSTTPTTLLSHTTSNDTLYLFFDATSAVINGKYDFNLWLTPDCSLAAGRIPIPFGVYFSCPDCGCKHTWFCTVFDGPQFHPTNPPCPAGVSCPKGVQTTGFQVERTTFGFNSAAYTAPMNPANANKNVAIFCDTVKMTVSNVIGATPVTDSLGVVISYDNVDYLKDTNEIFLFRRGFVQIKKTGGQILNCALDSTDLHIVRDDTTKTLTFRLDRCLTMLGTTLAPGDSLKFFGWFMVNPAGPMIDNFRKVPNLRAYGFAIFDGQEFACDNYGANFSVAKIPTVFAPPGGSEFPRGCSTTPFQYRLVTKNVGFSQFYTGGEFYPAVKVDSLVLDYDTAFLAVFQNLKVEVSIPGHPKFGNNFFVIPSLSAADGGHYVARFDTLARVPSYNAVTSYSFNLRMTVTPGCESLTGSSLGNSQFKMNPTLHYTDRFFAKNFGDGSCADERTDARTQNLTYSDPPTVSFEPVTNPNLLLQNDTAEWVIKQCNTSTKSDANQTWLAANFDTAQLEIIGFEVIDNPASPQNLPLKTFSNGQIFALTPAVLRQAGTNTPVQICNTIRIRAILKQCGTFPIGLKMGWQCAAITDPNWTPDDYAPCAEETLELSVTALDPALDATVINQPAEYPSLCDTLSMDLLVRNTGQGPAFDVSSTFSIPLLGATLVPGSVEIAWPSDSTFQPALFDPTFVGNTLRGKYYRYGSFDSLHTGLATDGLPGFDALAPGKTNEFKLRYKFTTGCEFVGGVQTFYRFSGKKACGTPTNTESGESLPIQVAGISANGTARFEVGFGAGSILAAGGTSQLEIFAQNTTAVASDAQDKIQVKLPTNIVYQPGSSVAVQPSGWSPGNPQIQTVGGIQILTWTLPAGLLQNDTATLRFAVATPALACNSDLEASVLTVRSINYSCPNGALTCPVNVLTTDGGERFFDLNIGQHADFAGPDVQICPGGSVQLNAAQPGFSDYSWSPAASLDDPIVANPVASPSQTTTYTVLAIDQDGCANVDEITVSIGSSLMVLAGSDDASCGQNTGAVVVTVLGGSGNYTYQWSPNVSTGAAANNLAPGTYLVTVTDATNGCTDEAFASVNMIGSAVSVAATPMSATTVNPTSGKISLNITGGTQPFTIAWAGPVNGSQSAVNQPVFAIQNLTAGAYTVTVTDANGCSGTASATVLQDVIDNLSLVVSTQADTSCCVGKGVIFLTVGGGVGNYQFAWSPVPGAVADLGGGVFRVDDVDAGVYDVTVTDGSGLTRTASATVADACQCAEIFEDETVLVPSGVEAFCVGIPYLFIDYYPIYVNGKLYDGPVHPCDFDTVVYYAFSFLPGEGFDGPYKLQRWQGKGQVVENVVFQDLYDLTDSLNTWEPDGAWLLDDATSLIFGGDPYDQNEYGPMEITHLPTQSRFLVNTNYTGFAYGTEIFVEPFDGKVTITAYDSTTCCADSVCVIFVNPCEDLLPVEPFLAYTDAPTVCIPIEYDQLFNYFVFVDNLTVTGLAASCNGGAESQFPVAGLPGFHEMIVIDTVRWCADTTPLLLIERPTPTTLRFTTQQGVPLANMCVQPDGQLGFSLDFNYCELPKNGLATQTQPGGLCFNYAPDAGFVGYDSMCVTLCDEYGICDTTLYIFEMKAGLPPLLTQRDTFYLTTQINTPINGICLPTNELQSAPTGLGFCSGPNHGVYIPTGVPCFNYMPNLDFAGIDQVCAFVCDATNTCDTAIFIIMVETPDTSGAMPNVDTVFISMPVNTPYTGLCLSTAELNGAVTATVNSCAAPKHGQFLAAGATCVNFQPAQNFVGLDTACLFICDNLGKCDTTIVVIMVTPNDSTPDNHNIKFDVLQLTTLVNTPIAQTCLDLSELPGKPEKMTILELPKFGFASPTGSGVGCFRYEPEKSYIGSDAMLIEVCDDLGLCDTTLVEIKILPDNQVLTTRDTLDFTMLENTTLSGICLDESELGGPGTAFEFCGGLAHGDLGTVGLPCFSYSPNTDFVGADEVCLVLCDAGGLCDTTLVRIQVLPDNPPPAGPTLDTLALTVFVNIPTGQICLDTSELTGALFGGPAICAFGQHGTFDFPGGSCFVYYPTPNYLGPDEACLFVCDDNGVCDTTILLIKVIDTQGSTTVDTIQLTTLENVPIILTCLDTTELPGNVAYMDFCGLPQNGTFTSLSASCFRFEPAPNFVGNDLGCIVVCDDAGVCDTTIVKITVQDNAQGPTPGFLVLTTPKNTPITAICLDESELNSSAVSFGFCGGQIYGTLNSVGVPCFEYMPSTDFVGDDFACVYICDATGLCDTTTLYITVTDIVNPPTPTVDTLRITTTENVPLPIICLSSAQLGSPSNDLIFCELPQNGTFTATSDSCFSFTPNTDFVGQDTGCVIICDGQNVCDTTIIFITVLPDNGGPSPQIDTIRLTTLENVPLPNICGDVSEIGGPATSFDICDFPANGDVAGILAPCVTYSPNAGFTGQDTFCLVVCNDQTLLCDTTIFVITVQPDNGGPLPQIDTIRLTTLENVPLTNLCADVSEIGGPATSFDVCGSPANGSLTNIAAPCVGYEPNLDFVGQDTFCLVVCNSQTSLCDTTIFVITVQPDNGGPLPQIDTIRLTTLENVPLANLCADLSEIGGPATSFDVCGSPTNGGLTNIAAPCVDYEPNLDFVGQDTFCLVVCNDQTLLCDTTIFVITVQPDQTGSPTVDTLRLTTPENTPLPNICADLSQIGTATAMTICEQPTNGTVMGVFPPCVSYSPNLDFVGVDTFCFFICNAQGLCDTSIVIVTVTDTTTANPNPEPDTIRITTNYQTVSDTFCLSTADLSGLVADLTFCGLPAHGTFAQIGDSCLTYTPDAGFVGNDTACVILCTANGTDCDTTIIILTVLPPGDCDIFAEDSISLEIPSTEPFGTICLDSFSLMNLLDFDFFDNGQPYANGFFGCNYDSCFAYTYFTVPDLGQIGPYRLDFWYFNGDTLTLPTFQNIAELADSIQAWDPQGGWQLDPSTLTIRTCSATWKNYGDIKITQLGTAGVAEIEINVNLQPQGTQIRLTPGQHLVTVFGPDCVDSLWVNVMVSNELVIDTFIYLDEPPGTICLDDLGINTASITDVQFLCPDASGTEVAFNFDATTNCLTFDGLAVGVDTFCLKLQLGTDSCFYLTVRVTVLEPLPCTGFIAASQLAAISPDCQEAEVCVDFPFALLSQYSVTDGSIAATTFACPANPQGVTETGFVLQGMGTHTLIFTKNSDPTCADTVTVTVSCSVPGEFLVWIDTIFTGQTDSLCFDTTGKGALVSMVNNCPGLSGQFADFQLDTQAGCVFYTGVDDTGTDTACVVVCFANNQCDTVLLVVAVVPPTLPDSLPPVAVNDFDTLYDNSLQFIPVLANDTLNGLLTGIRILTQPSHGSVSLLQGGVLTYDPQLNYCNAVPDSLQYEICNPFGCDSAWVFIHRPCTEIKIYNGFSPNGDGMNEVFFIEGVQFFPGNFLQVFNRWGTLVFSQKDYLNTWRGTWNDQDLPDGVYFYVFNDGTGRIFNGHLMILR